MTAKKKQNAFVFYLGMLGYMVLAAIVRIAALAPLACLFVFEGALRLLALLCPVLLILVVLPLRFSFAQAMAQKPRRFNIGKAFSFAHYGDKLKAALRHALSVAVWGIPLAAMGGFALYSFKTVEYLDLYSTVKEWGDICAPVLADVSVWLNGVIGTAVIEQSSNNFMVGVGVLGAAAALGVLILLCGAVHNSVNRYIWAAAENKGLSYRDAKRAQLKGRFMRRVGIAILNLLLWVPFLLVVGGALKATLSDLSTVMMMAVVTRSLPMDTLMEAAAPCAFAFGVLYLPLLPLRRWNTACCALGTRKADKKVDA